MCKAWKHLRYQLITMFYEKPIHCAEASYNALNKIAGLHALSTKLWTIFIAIHLDTFTDKFHLVAADALPLWYSARTQLSFCFTQPADIYTCKLIIRPEALR